MQKNKYISLILVSCVFILFALLQCNKNEDYDVLQVNNPFEIVVDKNKNGLPDVKETVNLDYGYSYFSKGDITLSEKLHLDNTTAYAFAYLTEKFINDVLLDKKVRIKAKNGKSELYLGKEKYQNILNKSGLFFIDGKPLNKKAYLNRLNQIKKSDFKLYNAKSNKYHKLDCEYAHLAHNYVLLASYQLPKGAKPCKICLAEKYNKSRKFKNDKRHKSDYKQNTSFCSGAIKVIVNDYTKNLVPNRKCNTEICNELVKQIDNSKSTIDIAIYGYDRVPRIEKAIRRAISRGVKIRLVHDITSANTNIYANTFYFSKLIGNYTYDKAPAGVQNKNIYTNSIMHDKFYIFDNSVVVTGSANLSHTDMSDYNSNVILVIYSKRIAQIYAEEFEQMYNNKFHTLKSKISNKTNIQLGNSNLSVYFSPVDNIINTALIPLINGAKKYIYIPIFAFTDNSLADSLIRAKKRGVDVRVILDATNAKNSASKHTYLRKNGVLVKTENYAGKLHSKSIIIDNKYTVIGSMNFSKSGNKKNDENIILLKDSKITLFYKKFFEYLWEKIPNYWLTHDVSAESVYSVGSCNDGIDNDYDGKTDIEDEGCKFKPSVNVHINQRP